jgi:gamma-glutamyl hercynylcysteine S-oxide synthase
MGVNQASAIVSEAEAARCGGKPPLAAALRDARARSLALFAAYEAALGPDLRVPCTPELNLPLWELGHIGWFADWWLARNPQRHMGVTADPVALRSPARQSARGVNVDAVYDSSKVPHNQRWQMTLPDADAVRADLADSLHDTLALLADATEDDASLYFFRLALFHEDMHTEAAVYMAQTLGFDPLPPRQPTLPLKVPLTVQRPGALSVAAAAVTLGRPGPGFAFDNELGAHAVPVGAFEIDAQPVTWAQFLPFVESGSYAQRRFWGAPGWIWRLSQDRRAPRYLRHTPQGWEQQAFGHWRALDPAAPASHLTAFEAQAWCAWAGRRLPTEAEWTLAAQDPGFVWGSVWEWTASAFAPFPGFVAHPYVDYSQPWFDGRPVLKGASSATHPRMRHPQYRNYFPPERNDIVAGFRSVAAD